MTYSVHTKASWDQNLDKGWEETFYPSLVKKIRKSNDYFENLFNFKVSPIVDINEASEFFDLYDKEIASRKNYLFKQNEKREMLSGKISGGKKYFQAILRKKDTNEYAGGIIFTTVEKKLSFSFRVFDKQIRSTYRAQTSVDFWVEKKMYEYSISKEFTTIIHGNDNYPNKGRAGLVLFKLKVGSKPKISKLPHDIIEVADDEIALSDTPTFFWDKSNENNYFQKAHLFYRKNGIDENVLSEMIKVMDWTGIELDLHKI